MGTLPGPESRLPNELDIHETRKPGEGICQRLVEAGGDRKRPTGQQRPLLEPSAQPVAKRRVRLVADDTELGEALFKNLFVALENHIRERGVGARKRAARLKGPVRGV